MNKDVITSIMVKSASQMDIKITTDMAAQFELYCKLLISSNQHVNLTAIENFDDIARLHFLDSLFLLKVMSFKNTKVIDIGSGAGFPGVVLKIAEPSIDLTLLDATKKRITFLENLCPSLGLEARCIHARAEELCQSCQGDASFINYCQGDGSFVNFREQYDIVVSRAVAKLNMLCELCLPYLRIGGFFPVMKGVDSDDEINEAGNAIKTLGAEIAQILDYTIPGTDVEHRIILLKKIIKTPGNFPRRFALIKKKPL